jgi:hypothetical protein
VRQRNYATLDRLLIFETLVLKVYLQDENSNF